MMEGFLQKNSIVNVRQGSKYAVTGENEYFMRLSILLKHFQNAGTFSSFHHFSLFQVTTLHDLTKWSKKLGSSFMMREYAVVA